MAGLLARPPNTVGAVVVEGVDRTGVVRTIKPPAEVSVAYLTPETNHSIAEPFWRYLNAEGQLRRDNRTVSGRLFQSPFYASGLPISEPYWTRVVVGEQPTDVLIQAFERRVLTFTPRNAPNWRVEMGNVGRHYYRWRYGSGT